MVYLRIKAKVKSTGDFIEHIVSVDNRIYKTDDDSLYGFVSDFLDETHGDIFKWFRFERIN
jgi:hypothetical protein